MSIVELEILCVSLLELADAPLYIVGGFVRDLLLGHLTKDIDLVVEGDSATLAKRFHERFGGEFLTFKAFGTAKVSKIPSFPGVHEIDFAAARSEIYKTPGALPSVSQASLREDLSRRDFTINAVALPLGFAPYAAHESSLRRQYLVDPLSGLSDIDSKMIRILHEKSFLDDPTRIFRALRYAGRLDFSLANSTAKLLEEALTHDALSSISLFRIFNELKKICDETKCGKIFKLLSEHKLFAYIQLPSKDAETRYELFPQNVVTSIVDRDKISYEELLLAVARNIAKPIREIFFNRLQIPKKKWKEYD